MEAEFHLLPERGEKKEEEGKLLTSKVRGGGGVWGRRNRIFYHLEGRKKGEETTGKGNGKKRELVTLQPVVGEGKKKERRRKRSSPLF